jgi:hypothetical protein
MSFCRLSGKRRQKLKNKLFTISLILLFIISACAQQNPDLTQSKPGTALPVQVTSIPSPETLQPTPSPTLDVLPTPLSGGGFPLPVQLAQADLAGRLKLTPEQVQVKGVELVDWPDSCLDVHAASEKCAKVIIPGFRVLLTVGTVLYEYHTNADGRLLRLVERPVLVTDGEQARPILEWTSSDCGQLIELTVTPQGLFYGKCGQSLKALPGFDPLQEPVRSWINTLAPFETDTVVGKVKFSGLSPLPGDLPRSIATAAEQRKLAEWARLQFETAQSGRMGAAWGLAFGYQRDGGIAGFCDSVGVYLDGRVLVSTCKGLNSNLYLTASELQQVYDWFDGLQPLDYSHSDSAVADGMKISLIMPGVGTQTADDATIQALVEFAASLFARVGYISRAGVDQENARVSLQRYFEALNSGDYTAAAKLYAGPTDLLKTWNPDIQDNLPAWLERGCQQNGLVCMLPRSITDRGQDLNGGNQFLVEFNNSDRTLFIQGPCCGETSGPRISSFLFTVTSSGPGGWQVLELPPYVP